MLSCAGAVLSRAAVATIYWELASLGSSAELFRLLTFLIFAASMWGKSEMKVLVAQLCPTLCDPMDCSPPGSSVHGILQVRILKWIVISSSRESSRPRNRTQVSCITGRVCTIWTALFPFFRTNSCCCSVARSCPTLYDPMHCSTPGFPVLHHLSEFAPGANLDVATQPSHPLLSPSSSALNLSQHQGLFQWVSSSHKVAEVLELQL